MRRAVITSAATAAGVVLLLSLKPHGNTPAPAIGSQDDTGPSGTAGEPSGGPAAPSAAPATGAPSAHPSAHPSVFPDASAASRSVTGGAVDTRYGPVQVKVTLSGTRITAVDVVQYPSEDRRDREINANALPVLNKEAIAAQSAHIDIVSGATYTSNGYVRSLQSALDRAGR
ncbi:FMN-binding protein [Kitasatospora purpeofusca]|uniref:FMN-binding protein n=1 Tax=Kitasatospora purpeofusca TaxID=67352 RepID=UPI002E1066DC|nr:FMN-binding protein [Kitasatospora purpeofusca]WSR29698.1 FMN-binding protein [Kitasatospora purpeofusca]WSR37925.1 FMN-binding protein [Kitasatospora purpeofusca]